MLRPAILLLVVLLLPLAAATAAPLSSDEGLRSAEDLIAAGRNDEAQKVLERLDASGEKDARVPFLLAQCEVNGWRQDHDAKRVERIRSLLDEATRRDPGFGGPWFLRGLLAFLTNDPATAVDAYGRALDLGYRPLDTRPNLALSLFEHGRRLASAGEDTAAIDALDRAERRYRVLKNDLRYLPAARASYRDLWRKTLVNLAAANQAADNMPRAEQIDRDLIAEEPDNFVHWFNLGLLYGKWHKWDAALEAYGKALELCRDPDFLAPHLYMGWILSQQGRREEAKQHLDRFLARYPDDWYGHYYLGQHYENVGEVDAAIREFRRCVELSPTSYAAMYPLYRVLVRAGKAEEAEGVLAEYRRLEEQAGEAEAPSGDRERGSLYGGEEEGEPPREPPDAVQQAIGAASAAGDDVVPEPPAAVLAARPAPAAPPAPVSPPSPVEAAPGPVWPWALPVLGALLLASLAGFFIQSRSRGGAAPSR